MVDRQWLGDVGLAVLLALPTAVLARPSTEVAKHSSSVSAPQVQLALAEPSAVQTRFSLPR